MLKLLGEVPGYDLYYSLTTIILILFFLNVETDHLDNDTEIFQNPHEGKEQGDFVDYGWASIGSFDNLDRIFR